jgi:hypothetical protein
MVFLFRDKILPEGFSIIEFARTMAKQQFTAPRQPQRRLTTGRHAWPSLT